MRFAELIGTVQVGASHYPAKLLDAPRNFSLSGQRDQLVSCTCFPLPQMSITCTFPLRTHVSDC